MRKMMRAFAFVVLVVSACDVWGRNVPVPRLYPGDPETVADSWRESTDTRERICLNGLWRVRAALGGELHDVVPNDDDGWGWGKIPSVWLMDNFWSDGQEMILGTPKAAKKPISIREARQIREWWYRRTFETPVKVSGKRAVLVFDQVISHVVVFIDGQRVGEVGFPGGEVDVTDALKPGVRQSFAFFVSAWPRSSGTLDFSAPDRVAEKSLKMYFRGLCGDVFLDLRPQGDFIRDTWVETSVAREEIRFFAEMNAVSDTPFRLVAEVSGCGEKKVFTSQSVLSVNKDGIVSFSAPWKGAKLWDTDKPANIYTCRLSVLSTDNRITIDAALPFRFGFREIEIRGKDLYLNGTRIHLRARTCAAMRRGAIGCAKKPAVEACRRILGDGFNFVVSDNYSMLEGEYSYIDGILDACDETGLLYSLTLPHVKDYGLLSFGEGDTASRYRTYAKWLIGKARRHPSVIAYAMTHNLVGFAGDLNPLKMDGSFDPLVHENNEKVRLRRIAAAKAEEIVRAIDSTRLVYHHESGSFGSFHTANIYLDWAPIQERSDWLEDWAKRGTRPMFFVEWGAPHVANWSSKRDGTHIWGPGDYQTLLASEYAAAFRGDAAYEASQTERTILSQNEQRWAAGAMRWMYELRDELKDWNTNYLDIQGLYLADNLRAHRAWGISAILPWDCANDRRRRQKGRRIENPDRFKGLKRPGLVVDYTLSDKEYVYDNGVAEDFDLTSYGRALVRWNRPDCVFIGGGEIFTDKQHNYRSGELIKKALVLLNDRRHDQDVAWRWTLANENGRVVEKGGGTARVEAGSRKDVAISLRAPKEGRYTLAARCLFASGDEQTDTFVLDVRPSKCSLPNAAEVLLYDSKGLTAAHFSRLGIAYHRIGADALGNVPEDRLLVIGRESLSREIWERIVVRPNSIQWSNWKGRVLVFEQTASMLESIGFRTVTYGMRQAFPRATVDGLFLAEDELRDWAGESTLVKPYFEGLSAAELFSLPRDVWCGYLATRVWRCRNRGSVASVLLEKPHKGDWLALCDGAFDLQYSPLLELTTAAGRILFCQLDVTGRTVSDPVADDLVHRMVARASNRSIRRAFPGWALGMRANLVLQEGNACVPVETSRMADRRAILVSRGAKKPKGLDDDVAAGAKVLCLGLTADEIRMWSPVELAVVETNGCFYSRIESPPRELNGLSNADWAWHGSLDFAAFTEPAEDGNAAFRVVRHGKGCYVFWQTPPWCFNTDARPYMRFSRRHAEYMLARLLANLSFRSEAVFPIYADAPIAGDDPYRYRRW